MVFMFEFVFLGGYFFNKLVIYTYDAMNKAGVAFFVLYF
ncbi:hypothetical protein GARC_1698 [Paraglaciecola arctica BSs20135]|uniref:Uncharacterized protein n=1 Tax=Paraglaciecola arctica BSs20135 TaxID=493475 RepID=K6Z5F4_9ALTE|nr:hypothetical protein GARC_1698 [Paraglaciecola arctica BSs20135]